MALVMFDSSVKRVGFACKYVQLNKKGEPESIPELNTGGTTLTFLKKTTTHKAEEKLWEVLNKNISNTYNLVRRVSQLEPSLRMVRLTSDMMTGYTHSDWEHFYKRPDVIRHLERLFAPIGELARANDIRLSFHPGQYTVLASDSEDIVKNSIKEFEYHVDMARWMGYGNRFQDFKINVHIAGRQGPSGIKRVLGRLSPEARNCITIENDEMSWGIDDSLELGEHCALVLDIHHHFINSGEYIQPSDDRCKRIVESWRGQRPVIHYSYSRNEHLPKDFNHNDFPLMENLLKTGCKKQKLRAHSDDYPNTVVNEWALSFLETSDIMCESKFKNLASFKLHDFYKSSIS